MRRRNRMNFNEERETKKIVIISLIVLIITVITFIVAFVSYNNYIKNSTEIAKEKSNAITQLINNNQEGTTQASSNIGKKVNEVEESKTNAVLEIDKIAINTSNMVKENTTENTNTQTSNVVEKKEEKLPDPTFIKPVEGNITKQYSKDTLQYSNTLEEWITHNGIDIIAPKTTIVKASSEGTIKSIKNDPRYGLTVVIEHNNGFKSIYSNLLTAEFVKEGETVKKGQTIATVGTTATFEIADEPHLHFEITKNDEYLNPEIYIK